MIYKNGAHSLVEALSKEGVQVCFANPGTSEIHLIHALSEQPGMRSVLCLFEGVVTGAADGYGRMKDKPAITLLHLGPGYANGMANLHNAMRANTPLINIVGDHATTHQKHQTPLSSDIPAHAQINSNWVITSESPDHLVKLASVSVKLAKSRNGQIITLIVPADHAWGASNTETTESPSSQPLHASNQQIYQCVQALINGKKTALILNGHGLREDALVQAGRIAEATQCDLFAPGTAARWQRGCGRVAVKRIPYFGEMAKETFAPYDQIILLANEVPVSFFAYPDKPNWLIKDNCKVLTLASPHESALQALTSLCALLNASDTNPQRVKRNSRPLTNGALTPSTIGHSLNTLMPSNAIVSDESITSGPKIFSETIDAEPHDWLSLTGGSIGQGLPLSIGAAVACPNRKVIALQADGSAMYTNQALWTIAREQLDITIVILNNSGYAILKNEFYRVGIETPSQKSQDLMNLTNPSIDWQLLSKSMGLPALKVDSAQTFHAAFEHAMSQKGPLLIEAILAQ